MRQLVSSADSAAWIAEDGDGMAGFAIVEWPAEHRMAMAYLQTIEVAPGRRGQGVGAELLRRVEASARAAGAQSIWLHVSAENAGAIRLYEAAGYRGEGREEDYYGPGMAGLVYGKELAGKSAS
jgi:ribosomal protein S18 acetylase RimI-like enzyme